MASNLNPGTAKILIRNVTVIHGEHQRVALKFKVLATTHPNLLTNNTYYAVTDQLGMAALETDDVITVNISGVGSLTISTTNSVVSPLK